MADQSSRESPTSPRRVVFFVDDEVGVQRLTRKLLERAGFTVIQALTADEAERVAEDYRDPIDVLLMDINLPDGWGATVAQRLRSIHPEMATVFVTGAAAADPILSGGLQDAEWVLHKPFNKKELLAILERALGDRRRDGDRTA